MGILGDIFGAGEAAQGISKIAHDILAFFPNAEQRAQVAAKLQDLELAIANNQSATNTEEAKNGSLLIAGWRPAVGWVLAIGFTYSLAWPMFHGQPIDKDTIYAMLYGMLGLGTWRTADKLGGVATQAIKKIFK